LCRREGIAESLYYSWSKKFLEAGKKVANHPLQFNPALRSIADRQDAFSRRTVAIELKR
jgi:hypothetical protein